MDSYKSSVLLSFILFLSLIFSCKPGVIEPDKIETRVNQLLSKMTLDEKIGQMTQIDPGVAGGDEQLKKSVRDGRYGSILNLWGVEKVNEIQKIAVEESRLGIPLLIGRDVIHGYRTIFPIPLGMAASWNPEIVKKAFRISAIECSSQGIKWTFAPMIDITWDPDGAELLRDAEKIPTLLPPCRKPWLREYRVMILPTRQPLPLVQNISRDMAFLKGAATTIPPIFLNRS